MNSTKNAIPNVYYHMPWSTMHLLLWYLFYGVLLILRKLIFLPRSLLIQWLIELLSCTNRKFWSAFINIRHATDNFLRHQLCYLTLSFLYNVPSVCDKEELIYILDDSWRSVSISIVYHSQEYWCHFRVKCQGPFCPGCTNIKKNIT